MNTGKQITLSELTRQEKLLIWFKRAKKSRRALAKFAGISPVTVARWMRADSLSLEAVDTMREFGVPPEYLPQAIKKFGPLKGNVVEAVAEA